MEGAAVSLEDWQARLDGVDVNSGALNQLVMNYLVVEGFKDAAEAFVTESGVKANVDLQAVESRMKVRHAIQNGDVVSAIDMVNDFNPEILDTNSKLYFRLHLQRLLELIRSGSIEETLQFAKNELAPLGEEHPEFLAELEEAMALLAFPDKAKSPLGHLLDTSQRQKTASELNAAILASQEHDQASRMPSLLRLLVWAQTEMASRGAKAPNLDTTGKLCLPGEPDEADMDSDDV